jgi:prophage DNA circulation protein
MHPTNGSVRNVVNAVRNVVNVVRNVVNAVRNVVNVVRSVVNVVRNVVNAVRNVVNDVRNVVIANTFDIEIIDAIVYTNKISNCSYRHFFLVQNLPVNNKNRTIQHTIQIG